MNIPEGYKEAATKAAERWKANQNPELKAQIIASWRMTKEYMKETQSRNGVRIGQLQGIWQEAFKAVPGWDFDFTKDDRNDF